MYRVHTLYRTANEKASTKVPNYWSAIEGYAAKPDPWRLSLKPTTKQKQNNTRHIKTKNKCSKTIVSCRKSFLESIYQPTIEKTIQYVVFLKWISTKWMIRKQSEKSNGMTMEQKHRNIKGNKLKLETEKRQYRKYRKDKCASRGRDGFDFNSASKRKLRQLQ